MILWLLKFTRTFLPRGQHAEIEFVATVLVGLIAFVSDQAAEPPRKDMSSSSRISTTALGSLRDGRIDPA